jgi:hypothetical protein
MRRERLAARNRLQSFPSERNRCHSGRPDMPVVCALGSAAGGRGTCNERSVDSMDSETQQAFQVVANKLDDLLAQQAKSVLVIKKLFENHGSGLDDLKQMLSNQPELADFKSLLKD